MDYTPGKGGGTIAAGSGAVTATVLPQTGINFVNDAAIAAVVALVVWAVAYRVLNRKTA